MEGSVDRTHISSSWEEKYSLSFHVMETTLSPDLMGHSARLQTLPLTYIFYFIESVLYVKEINVDKMDTRND